MKDLLPTETDGRLTPIQAIRKNCLQCMGGSSEEVAQCQGESVCFLYPYRMGKRPPKDPYPIRLERNQTKTNEGECTKE